MTGNDSPSQEPRYLVPANTRQVLSKHASKCLHLGLILGRYVPEQAMDPKAKWNDKDKAKYQDGWLRTDVLRRFQDAPPAVRRLQAATYARWLATTAGAQTFRARTLGRLVVGLGGKGVLEFGLTLQHASGLPIIPGSALKGLTRTYALLVIAAELGLSPFGLTQLASLAKRNDSRRKARLPMLPTPLEFLDEAMATGATAHSQDLAPLAETMDIMLGKALGTENPQQLAATVVTRLNQLPEAARYRAAFGSQGASGDCIFYDAVVAELPPAGALFELDVMTPHFGEYYGSNGAKPPHDAGKPVPVTFMTVAAGTTFAFAIGTRRGGDPAAAQQARAWLGAALHELGVGAKTAAGYGVFEPPR